MVSHLKGREGFAKLQALADALGGSLPAEDAGWVPVSHQVGQSGKYVAPAIHVAVGLSGTPQHMAGVAPHTDIIGKQNRSEIELDQVKAYRRGLVLDAMLRSTSPQIKRGVMRGTHEYFNRLDEERQAQMARALNRHDLGVPLLKLIGVLSRIRDKLNGQ